MLEVSTEPLHIKTSEIIDEKGEGPWYESLFTDGRNNVGLICDVPGAVNDHHFHPDFNEFWIVLKGQLEFEIGDYPVVRAGVGDIVLAPQGDRHLIRTVGDESSVRLHVSKIGSNHDSKNDRSPALIPFPDQTEPPNLLHTTLGSVIAQKGEPQWVSSVVQDSLNTANLIYSAPGTPHNAHWHPDFDEWWTILKGELTWDLGEKRPVYSVKKGDIMFVPRGLKHYILTQGDETSFRLAITDSEGLHVYQEGDADAPPPRE
ncbi:MAG: cupin domain-containing protein [SAR202 cluster bacterium]|jgi:quercetin dioxygenase-like cupin family protein|nr:cupin domain-containing protein [SAR202 cluster bacterium]MDP6300342.1 cupin domain-containing protein [SAR202 cluster bacterium]MDP7103116.1 cupin domain-containing protein [SAR202 cluster bacterium]MDP7224519.1 cupin domain-containing protein [SAR202 cluster bacterium]MDP7414096.1 cupin domain-containing protein [SAR202 cluster bacterium]|tara:strand:+ start:5288 stop:6067 length:780 start_codon:yes stop_codon:yes gene_type:complete